MFWIIANDCACLMIYPRMSRKQIELWGIKSTSGNFRPYQIQTATIHFNVPLLCREVYFFFFLRIAYDFSKVYEMHTNLKVIDIAFY